MKTKKKYEVLVYYHLWLVAHCVHQERIKDKLPFSLRVFVGLQKRGGFCYPPAGLTGSLVLVPTKSLVFFN